jgi:hypothetical protein
MWLAAKQPRSSMLGEPYESLMSSRQWARYGRHWLRPEEA